MRLSPTTTRIPRPSTGTPEPAGVPDSARGARPRRLDSHLLFELGADVYAWFTAQAAWRQSCARMAAHLPPGAGLRVVDLGCGPGVAAIELARLRPDLRLVGLDIAQRMLAQARRRWRRAGLPARGALWVRADAARLPFATASLDALTGHSFLYLLYDRERSLGEMWRVLRPGGRVVLMEPHARTATLAGTLAVSRDPRYLLSVLLWRPFSRLHGRFTASTLTVTLQAAGFAECQVEEVMGGLGLMAHATRP